MGTIMFFFSTLFFVDLLGEMLLPCCCIESGMKVGLSGTLDGAFVSFSIGIFCDIVIGLFELFENGLLALFSEGTAVCVMITPFRVFEDD